MHLESARVTWVGEAYTVDGKNGDKVWQQDFIAQWHDDQSGKFCSLGFCVRNRMDIIGKIKTNMIVKFDFVISARVWSNPKTGRNQAINNTRILANSLHCVARKG